MAKITITGMVLTYNCMPTIKYCLDSFKKFDEIVVLDSNSDDGTLEYLKKHDKVTLFVGPQIEDRWIPSYNSMIRECETSHAFYLDSDELINVNAYTELKKLWKKDPNIFPVTARATVVFEDKCKVERHPDPQYRGGAVDKLRYFNPRNPVHDMLDVKFAGMTPKFSRTKHIILHVKNLDDPYYRKRLEWNQAKIKRNPNARSLYDEYRVGSFDELIDHMKKMPTFPLSDIVKQGFKLPTKKRVREALSWKKLGY